MPAAAGVFAYIFWLMGLTSFKDVHHWAFSLGPLCTDLDGGHLLWDLTSQCGFLNFFSVVSPSRITGLDPALTIYYLLVLFAAVGGCITFYFFDLVSVYQR